MNEPEEDKIIHISNKKHSINFRKITSQWNFSPEEYTSEYQLNAIKHIVPHTNIFMQTIIKQINYKLNCYIYQDEKKSRSCKRQLTTENILHKMQDCALCCYYCNQQMVVLYLDVLDKKQWTVDRIDNTLGHSADNYVLSCLSCNLTKRRRCHDKFKSGREFMNYEIVKVDCDE